MREPVDLYPYNWKGLVLLKILKWLSWVAAVYVGVNLPS